MRPPTKKMRSKNNKIKIPEKRELIAERMKLMRLTEAVFSPRSCVVFCCVSLQTHRQSARQTHQRIMHSARFKSFHFPSPSEISFLLSLHDSLLSFLLLPRHVYSFDNPMSYSFVCAQHPCTTCFLITCRCSSLHASLVFLRGIARIGSSHPPSFNSSHSCIAASEAYFSHVAGKRLSCPLPPVTHDCSCWSSHLPPCLCISDLLLQCFLLVFSPSTQAHLLPRKA